jgi:hypothetical protein
MFVVVAGQVVAEGLLGALWPGRSVSLWKEKRKAVEGESFRNQKRMVAHLATLATSTLSSTPPYSSRPLKTMLASPSLKKPLSSQDVDPSSRLVRDVGEFTFHFAIAFAVLRPLP